MNVAILDLGSNTFHLLVVSIAADGTSQALAEERHAVRMGEDGLGGGPIGAEAWRRGIDAAARLHGCALAHGARIVAVATGAIREASNGRAFLDALRERLRLEVQLLEGDEEARLSWLGARAAASEAFSRGGVVAVVDAGGGSVEIAAGAAPAAATDHRLATFSLPLGVLRLRRHLAADGILRAEDLPVLASVITAVAADPVARVRALRPEALVLAAGSARLAARLAGRDVLDLRTLDDLLASLVDATPADLAARGVPPGRRDTIGPAVVLLRKMVELVGLESARVAQGGLREGIVAVLSQRRPE